MQTITYHSFRKMKRLILISLIGLLAACKGDSDEQEIQNDRIDEISTHYLHGQIAGDLEVYMKLEISSSKDGVVKGEYYYASHQSIIELSGVIIGDTLNLDESIQGEKTGHFKGTFDDSESISDISSCRSFRPAMFNFALAIQKARRAQQRPQALSPSHS